MIWSDRDGKRSDLEARSSLNFTGRKGELLEGVTRGEI